MSLMEKIRLKAIKVQLVAYIALLNGGISKLDTAAASKYVDRKSSGEMHDIRRKAIGLRAQLLVLQSELKKFD